MKQTNNNRQIEGVGRATGQTNPGLLIKQEANPC